MIDDKLTQAIQSWLAAPQDRRSLTEGADLLLRLNRNRWMHAQILRKNNTGKLEYELRKYLRIRLEGMTVREVAQMERDVLPAVLQSLDAGAPVITTDADHPADGAHRGRRPDHDSLPAGIQAIYDRGGELYYKMKQTFETLKTMEKATPCDRHELITVLVDLDREYRDGWNRYDSWTPGQPEPTEPPAAPAANIPANKIQAARKYLSTGKPKLAAAESQAADALRAKMQQRIDLLRSAGQGFDDGFRSELEALGLVFE